MSDRYFVLFLICLPTNYGYQNTDLFGAIKYELNNSFNKFAPVLDITIETTNNTSKSFFIDLVEEVLLVKWNFHTQLDIDNEGNQSVGDFNLIFIDSYEGFRRLLPVIDSYKGDAPIYFIIVLKTSETTSIFKWMEKIFGELLHRMLDNVNILIDTIDGQILHYTYIPFQKSNCRSTKPFRTTRDFNASQETINLFPKKFQNLHGCSLRVLTRNFLFGRKTHYFNGLPEVFALEQEILNALKKNMNFEVKFIRAIVYDRLEVWPNGTAFGSFKLLKNGKADIMLGYYRHGPLQDPIFTSGVTYFNNWFVIAMLRPDPEFLKFSWIFAPFHSSVWISTFALLLGASLTIGVVSNNAVLVKMFELQPHRPKIFNSLVVAIGMAIGNPPRKNFLRLCFIIWSFGLLTIRSIYQGKLYDSYRTMLPTTTRLSVTQLLAEHYTIHMQTAYLPLFRNMSGIVGIKYEELTTDRKLNQALTKDSAIIDSFMYFYLTHNQSELAGLVMEPLLLEHICAFFQTHSSMAQIADMVVLRLIEGGILLRWNEHFEKLKNINFNRKKFAPVTGPILMGRFKYIMALFSVLYLVSGVVFVIEWVWGRRKMFKK